MNETHFESLISRASALLRALDPPGTVALERRLNAFRNGRPSDSRKAAIEVALILQEFGRPCCRPYSIVYDKLMAEFRAAGALREAVGLPVPTGNPGT